MVKRSAKQYGIKIIQGCRYFDPASDQYHQHASLVQDWMGCLHPLHYSLAKLILLETEGATHTDDIYIYIYCYICIYVRVITFPIYMQFSASVWLCSWNWHGGFFLAAKAVSTYINVTQPPLAATKHAQSTRLITTSHPARLPHAMAWKMVGAPLSSADHSSRISSRSLDGCKESF